MEQPLNGMTTVATSVALWRSLCLDAGLELRLKNGKPGRDADIEATLRTALAVPASSATLDAWLAEDVTLPHPKVTVERFLVAVLNSQAGFAQMMQDILATLIAADAQRAAHTLSISFKFHDMHDPIVQTLEQFREVIERMQKALEKRPMLPDSTTMWSIRGILDDFSPEKSNERPDNFPSVPQLALTGDARLDEQLVQISCLVADVQELWARHGVQRSEVTAAASAMSGLGPETTGLKNQLYAASDFWDVSVINGLQQLSTPGTSDQANRQRACEELAKALASLEWGDVWVDRTVRELLDILALPAWQRRHELYSVWVGTRLLEVARSAEPSLRFNPVDGILSFAFGGSRLATYERQGNEYEIWAELRSDLVGSSTKRKEKIQPDFRVVQAGLSPAGVRTVYVLECKHYLRSSSANFTTAAKDYARSCSNASVHVVNHGPANDRALRAALPADLQAGVQFMGDVKPGEEAASRFLCDAIRNVLFPGSAAPAPSYALTDPMPAPPVRAGCTGQIFLEWDNSLEDMDLALLVIGPDGTLTQSIDFRHTGDLDKSPFARFNEDVRRGPGVERIDIGAWHFNRYELIATNYSGSGGMTPDALQCRIVMSTNSTLIRCPSDFSASRNVWRIAELVVCGGYIDVVAIDSQRQGDRRVRETS